MRVHSDEFFYLEMNKLVCDYTMYFPMIFNRNFNLDMFLKAVHHVLDSMPHLKSRCKGRFWRAQWVGFEEHKIEDITEILEVNLDYDLKLEDFYSQILKGFILLEDRKIDLEKEPPIKIKVFRDKNSKRTVVFLCIHHAIADGRGSMTLISLFEKTYRAIKNGKTLPDIKNYRKIPLKLLKDGTFKTIKNTFVKKESIDSSEIATIINECKESTKKGIDEFEVLRIPKEKVLELKNNNKKYNYTTNDIIVRKMLVITEKLNIPMGDDKKYINVGIAIDNRKNIKEDIITVTNYASMSPFYFEKDLVNDRKEFRNKIKEFKKNASGASFSKEFMLMSFFPLAIQKKVFQGPVLKMIKDMSCKGIQTTNVGEMTRFIGDFDETLEYLEFIGPAGKFGLPIVSISLYKGDLSIYFRRVNDSTGICNVIKNMFEAEIT
ncbi:MAG TPA: condensation domain-containing protein [Tissierellales bacterium]|nr:condensation domain-containing protein [Tissierellales bacterium]